MISPSQRPLPDNAQHSQQTNIHAPVGIRTHDRSRRAAVDLRLRPRGYWDWHVAYRAVILSDNCLLPVLVGSSIVLPQPTQPTAHMLGGLASGGDERQLSNKIRTLYSTVQRVCIAPPQCIYLFHMSLAANSVCFSVHLSPVRVYCAQASSKHKADGTPN